MKLIKKNTGKNNIIDVGNNCHFNDKSLIKILGNDCKIKIDDKCVLNNINITMKGNNIELILGNSVEMTSTIVSMFQNCKLSIGTLTTLGDGEITIAEETSIMIGEDCMFAHNFEIRTSDMHPIYSLSSGDGINYGKDIHIGNHVWAGKFISIMKGVSIKDNTVIGMNTHIHKSIGERNVVVVGNPAKIVKKDIIWGRKMFNKTMYDDVRLEKYYRGEK